MSVPVSPKFPTILRDLVDKSKRVPDISNIDLSNVGDDFKVENINAEEKLYCSMDINNESTILGINFNIKNNSLNKLIIDNDEENQLSSYLYRICVNPHDYYCMNGEFCLITIPHIKFGDVSISDFNCGGILEKNNYDIKGYPFKYKFNINMISYGDVSIGYGEMYFTKDPTIGEERVMEMYKDFGDIKETISKCDVILKIKMISGKLKDFKFDDNIILGENEYISYIKTNVKGVEFMTFDLNYNFVMHYMYIACITLNVYDETINLEKVLIIPYEEVYTLTEENLNGMTAQTIQSSGRIGVIQDDFNTINLNVKNIFQTIIELPINTSSVVFNIPLKFNNNNVPTFDSYGDEVTISIFNDKASFHKSHYE